MQVEACLVVLVIWRHALSPDESAASICRCQHSTEKPCHDMMTGAMSP